MSERAFMVKYIEEYRLTGSTMRATSLAAPLCSIDS